MPRSTPSKEAGIVAYFRTAPLEVAQVVLGLAREALSERVARSTEAKARAAGLKKPKAPKAVAAPAPKAVQSGPAAVAAAPKKAKAKKRKARTRAAAPAPAAEIDLAEGQGGAYSEGDLNDTQE